MKAMTKKTLTFLMAAMLILGIARPVIPADAAEAWEDNVLTERPFEVFEMDLSRIESVTFLDTLKDAPANAWYMGVWANSNVRAWFTWENGMGQAYIAAEGGINGKNATEAMFKDMISLKEINFNGALHTEQSESMREMFSGCENLQTVDLSTLDTSNVTTMREMFRNCYRLKEVDVSGFDTKNVNTLYAMFSGCLTLKELDLTAFDTANVTNLGYLFSSCKDLETVKVSNWNTAKVNYMEGTFRWCDSLKEPDLKNWNVDAVTIYRGFMDRGFTLGGEPWQLLFNR